MDLLLKTSTSCYVFIFLLSCGGQKMITTSESIKQISFVQNGSVQAEQPGEYSVTLEKKAFEVQFFNKKYDPDNKQFHVVQIAAFSSDEGLQNAKVGMNVSESLPFSPGTGLAASKNGYENLYLDSSGHHYLSYESEKSKRLRRIGAVDNNLKLAFDIRNIKVGDTVSSLENSDLDILYLIILIDRNLNKVIDEGELSKVRVTFN